eukprot:GHVS01014861.1.p1 GENE.GHVS01014861.1~~GHVS01014861.1.p1  ORF type:complete len:391 (+),score=54.11 GHVS01014861.1:142-1173(+)
MLSVNAGKHNKTRPDENLRKKLSVFHEVEVCLKSSDTLQFFSDAHLFLMNNKLRNADTHERLKTTAKFDLQDKLLRHVEVKVEVTDIQFGVVVPAEVDNDTEGGHKMAEQDVVVVTVKIEDVSEMFEINGGTRREKHIDQELLRNFVEQGEVSYHKYLDGLYMHNAIFDNNTKLEVTDGNFNVVYGGKLSLLAKRIHVSTRTSAAGQEDIMDISMEIGIQGDQENRVDVTCLVNFNTSEIDKNLNTNHVKIKQSAESFRKRFETFADVLHTCALPTFKAMDENAILPVADFFAVGVPQIDANEVTCTAVWVERLEGKMRIGFLVNYPRVDNVDFSYNHVHVCE